MTTEKDDENMTTENEHQQTLQEAVVEANNIANDLFSASSPIAIFATSENNYITVIAAKSLFRMLYLEAKIGAFSCGSFGTIREKTRITDILDVLYSCTGSPYMNNNSINIICQFNSYIECSIQRLPCEIEVAIWREYCQYKIASELTQRQARIILIEALRECSYTCSNSNDLMS